MENEPESATSLAWLWIIEALASFKEVNISLLHDIIDTAPDLPDTAGKNAREMVALKCLEGLVGPFDGITKDGPPAQCSKATFDSSQSCEDVLQHILYETSESALIVGGLKMLKWDVSPFIMQKRAGMRCNLQQLKDTLLNGTHPYIDFLMEKSGLASENKIDSVPANTDCCIEFNRRLDGSSSDPQIEMEKSKERSLLAEDERGLSSDEPSRFSLLPSKRHRNDFLSEDEARRLSGSDTVYMNCKKLKQHLCSGEKTASPRGTELLEDSSTRGVALDESEDFNYLDKHQMGNLEKDVLVKDSSGPKRSGHYTDELYQGQSGIPGDSMTIHIHEDETHQVIWVKKVKNKTVFTFEPEASNGYHVERTLHKACIDDSNCDVGHDYHVETTNTVSCSGSVLKTVSNDTDVNMSLHKEKNDTSSDSDESDDFYSERIDIAMKKNEFCNSQCVVSGDSHVSVARSEVTVCMKCNKGGQLLSCNASDCPLVVHEKCLGPMVRINDTSMFYCPFCAYSHAISKYLAAKKKLSLTKKNISTFFHVGFEHPPKLFEKRLYQKEVDSQKDGVQDNVKICEDVDLGSKDERVNSDGGYLNEVTDRQSSKAIDTEQIMKFSESFDVTNSNHRENELNYMAPDVLAGEKNGNAQVDQECQGNTVAELEGNQNDDIHSVIIKSMNSLPADQGPVEAAPELEAIQHHSGDNKEEPLYALNIEGAESSADENDESIISKYSISFRRQKYHHTCPETPQSRRKKLLWTPEEEETLKEGVRKFSSSVERSPTIPWKKILEFGSDVFMKGRTPIDLKDKWRNLCRSPKYIRETV